MRVLFITALATGLAACGRTRRRAAELHWVGFTSGFANNLSEFGSVHLSSPNTKKLPARHHCRHQSNNRPTSRSANRITNPIGTTVLTPETPPGLVRTSTGWCCFSCSRKLSLARFEIFSDHLVYSFHSSRRGRLNKN